MDRPTGVEGVLDWAVEMRGVVVVMKEGKGRGNAEEGALEGVVATVLAAG